MAAAAELAGFDAYGFSNHPAPSQRCLDNGGHDALDALVTMAFAAATTVRLRLLSNIFVLTCRSELRRPAPPSTASEGE
jgi:alkanesulfonate monooxygenase SsuD/methylene tetrahydromethanopterin reductase-like flavin-dependent oxidoreductase (luciferase family)